MLAGDSTPDPTTADGKADLHPVSNSRAIQQGPRQNPRPTMKPRIKDVRTICVRLSAIVTLRLSMMCSV